MHLRRGGGVGGRESDTTALLAVLLSNAAF
jgi:hypothetical protein